MKRIYIIQTREQGSQVFDTIWAVETSRKRAIETAKAAKKCGQDAFIRIYHLGTIFDDPTWFFCPSDSRSFNKRYGIISL